MSVRQRWKCVVRYRDKEEAKNSRKRKRDRKGETNVRNTKIEMWRKTKIEMWRKTKIEMCRKTKIEMWRKTKIKMCRKVQRYKRRER